MVARAAPLPAHNAEAMAAAYATEGWKIDAAALAALDLVRTGDDRAAVVAAVRAVYLPWLDAGASALQALVVAGKVKLAQPAKPATPPSGAVLLFVDGLRVALAQRLADTSCAVSRERSNRGAELVCTSAGTVGRSKSPRARIYGAASLVRRRQVRLTDRCSGARRLASALLGRPLAAAWR